jgi:uncharacterized protein (DUF58 family)
VRELEEQTADNQVVIGLDTRDRWTADTFESAVTAAASLYIYSLRHHLTAMLWLPHTGLLQNQHAILSALAAVMPGTTRETHRLPAQSLLWLGADTVAPPALPKGSLWVQWQSLSAPTKTTVLQPTLTIHSAAPLLEQLQADLPTPY